MKRIREKVESVPLRKRKNCNCAECLRVAQIAAECRELPSRSTYMLLLQFTKCEGTARAFRGALKPFLLDYNSNKQLDEDSMGEESTDDGSAALLDVMLPQQPMSPSFLDVPVKEEEPFQWSELLPEMKGEIVSRLSKRMQMRLSVCDKQHYKRFRVIPDPDDLVAWRTITDYASVLAHVFTMHSVQLNCHPLPRFHRCRTEFTSTKHFYHVDGVVVNNKGDKNAWLSPSSLIHMLWKPFDSKFAARMSATSKIRELFYQHILTPADVPRSPAPKLEVLWAILLLNYNPARVALFWNDYQKLFKSPQSQIPGERQTCYEIQADFEANVANWQLYPASASWFQFQEDFLTLLMDELEQSWENNRNDGSDKHAVYDALCQGEPLPEGLSASVVPLGFVRCMVALSKRFDIYATELPLFAEELHVIGCADLILVDRVTGELLLSDFKNVRDFDLRLAGNPNANGIHPFTQQLEDTKYQHYRLQLSIYRWILNKHYFPNRFSNKLLLLNFRPSEPDAFFEYWMEPLDLTNLWALCPWNPDDPRHRLFNMGPTLIEPIPDTDPRCKGSTVSQRMPRGDTIEPDMVWTQGKYEKPGFPIVPDSIWKHPTRKWWGNPTAADIAATFESYLLNNAKLLHQLPNVIGKKVLCWCFPDGKFGCNGEVVTKYANLLNNGAFKLPPLQSSIEEKVAENNIFVDTSRKAREKRARRAAKAQDEKDGKVTIIHDDGF
jgi:hypothetical protein